MGRYPTGIAAAAVAVLGLAIIASVALVQTGDPAEVKEHCGQVIRPAGAPASFYSPSCFAALDDLIGDGEFDEWIPLLTMMDASGEASFTWYGTGGCEIGYAVEDLEGVGWNNRAAMVEVYCPQGAVLYEHSYLQGVDLSVEGRIEEMGVLAEQVSSWWMGEPPNRAP